MVVAPGWISQAGSSWATATKLSSSVISSVTLAIKIAAHSQFLARLKASGVLRCLKNQPSRVYSYEAELGSTADLECTLKECFLDEAIPTLKPRKFDVTDRWLDFLRVKNRLKPGFSKLGSLAPLSASIRVSEIFVQRWQNTERQPLVTGLDSCWGKLLQFK